MPVEESLSFAVNSEPKPENIYADYGGQSYPSTIESEALIAETVNKKKDDFDSVEALAAVVNDHDEKIENVVEDLPEDKLNSDVEQDAEALPQTISSVFESDKEAGEISDVDLSSERLFSKIIHLLAQTMTLKPKSLKKKKRKSPCLLDNQEQSMKSMSYLLSKL
jgi:hypothetical protein